MENTRFRSRDQVSTYIDGEPDRADAESGGPLFVWTHPRQLRWEDQS